MNFGFDYVGGREEERKIEILDSFINSIFSLYTWWQNSKMQWIRIMYTFLGKHTFVFCNI